MPTATEELTLIRAWVKETKAAQAPAPTPTSVPAKEPPAPAPGTFEPMAITGVAGFFPGCADVASFWRRLDEDQSLLTPIPPERIAGWSDGGRQGWGGFIPDISKFDAEAFNILPLEAEEMDPRQRLLLMSAWRTLEDAGFDPQAMPKSNTGVFIAGEGNEYAVLMNRAGFTPKMGFGQANGMLANRISYAFDFTGPSEMVDATCAGFAVALHHAVVALRAGTIDRAIVGAANLILLPDAYDFLEQAGQLSSGRTVKSFGRDGDGFLRAEGVGTILVERAADAVAAGRSVYAEIKHTAVNFNGRGGVSMASPNTEAHTELIKTCYREAGIDPRELGYVEAQGMGSPVADIAEWAAINRALTELGAETGSPVGPGSCRVSTLKPMLGHMHAAASLGALLKVIRSFQTDRIHRVLDYTEPNEYCDVVDSPCRIATATEAWARGERPRLAAVHSYGSSGNNAHILLQDPRHNPRSVMAAAKTSPGRVFQTRSFWFPSHEASAEPETADNDILSFVRETLGAAVDRFDRHAPFTELGLDSLSVGPFVDRLNDEFRVKLRNADIFSYATPVRLAAHIGTLSHGTPSPTHRSTPPQSSPVETDDIAIVGLSLQTAGAKQADEFWSMLCAGQSAIAPVPSDRLEHGAKVPPGASGGFLSDADTFDPLFFKIAPKESERMDPRHRKLLQAAWAAIEDSGHSPADWAGKEHGIFMGIEESDYPFNEQSPITAVHGGTAPARIGYFLDTKGPVLAISTACSSSLVAVHYACRSILNGESDCALAGGCNIISQPARSFYALSQMGDMLSPDGTCYAFDQRANGMVLGEAVGVVVLKRLSHAVRDRDSIYAVIKGSGINYDGRTNGLTAPNGARQRELYERVRRASGVEPAQIGYIVAHGTGTALGDPVECNALQDAFGSTGGVRPWCALTSPKTNVGHTQAASGIVNLITAALAVKHGEIPPSLNFSQANADIDLTTSPFYVNTVRRAWHSSQRFAAASSFGHSGTNAHVVLGSAPDPAIPPAATSDAGPVMVVLSAKSEERLRETVAALQVAPVDRLVDLAFTLQVGREPMEERLGFVVETVDEFRTTLADYLSGGGTAYRGHIAADHTAVALDLPPGANPPDLAQATEIVRQWVHGAKVDWSRWQGKRDPRRVHLPTYPFEKEHYWLAADVAAVESTSLPSRPAMPVMTFAETWVEQPLAENSALPSGGAVYVLSPAADAPSWRKVMTDWDATTTWRVLSPDDDDGGFTMAFREVADAGVPVEAVICLPDITAPESAWDSARLVPLVQALAAAGLAPKRLMFLGPFRDALERCHVDAWAVCDRSLKPVLTPTHALVVGVDLATKDEATARRDCLAALDRELRAGTQESVLYQDERRQVRRVSELTATASLDSRLLRTGGNYLITGGTGALGLLLAEHLVTKFGANVILTGRSDLGETSASRLKALGELGGSVSHLRVDVTDVMAMKSAWKEATDRLGAFNGVIHAAGVPGVGSVLEKSVEGFMDILCPKIQGTLALDEVMADSPLDFVVYFSSSAAVLGDFGSCDYAVGNRFQAAFARYRNERRARGERHGRTVAMQWPVWLHGGMDGAALDERTQFYLQTSGQRALETAEGLAQFEQLLARSETSQLVVAGEPERVRRFLGLERVAKAGSLPLPFPLTEPDRVTEQDEARVEEWVQNDLKHLIGVLLGIPPRKVKLETNLADFGFDSMSLASFAEQLSNHYGLSLTPALFFGHSTVQRLTRYLLEEHGTVVESFYQREAVAAPSILPAPVAPATTPLRSPASPLGMDEPIAIIGMSGRFPQARNITEMWRLLVESKDAVTEVPADRFDWREFYGDPTEDKRKSNGKWMGCLPGVAEFDPLFFEISPSEAEVMDPRQRHLLQESWKALEDAGYGPRQIADHRVGVFVGVEEGDYPLLAPEGELTSNHGAILASRLAYFLDFRGPAMAINTACSSSLVAAHQACSSLRNGECDTALVAGVSLQLTPAGHIAMGQSGMLSEDGKCRVFDQGANGMVPGEAAVAVVLKRLSQAEADGDPIQAVIRTSGVNYDGKTNGITAPNGVAQTELLRDVYARSRLDPGDIEYIVAHGTGTRLGDPVEVNALHQAFKDATSRRGYCALTSTKSNFGHTFAASGLVSVVSLVEALRHDRIPASLHCETDSDYIKWENSPFYVNKQSKPWPRRSGAARRGAVSAFGMSGTNAHLVIEDHAPGRSAESAATAPAYLLALSAKTAEARSEMITALAAALRQPEVATAGLARISYTLLAGRHHFPYRFAVVVRNVADAIHKMDTVNADDFSAETWQGKAPLEFRGSKALRRQAETMLTQAPDQQGDAADYEETLGGLAELYCQGYDFDWQPLFGVEPLSRVSLPTYPFARETYWVERRVKPVGATGRSSLHPLVQVNTSTLREQRFSSVFDGSELFLAHHRVQGDPVLPGVAYLEMARAALALSDPFEQTSGVFQLSQVVWGRSLAVHDASTELHIALDEEDDRVGFEVFSGSDLSYTTGKMAWVEVVRPAPVDVPAVRERMSFGVLSSDACYAAFTAAGMDYGPAYRALRCIQRGDHEALAQIVLPDSIPDQSGSFGLHPSMLDSAFQATLGLEFGGGGLTAPRIPFALERLIQWQSVPATAWVWVRPAASAVSGVGVVCYDLDIVDEGGVVCVQMCGVAMRTLPASRSEKSMTWSFPRILSGDEFYGADHGGVLPGVVSLEWARAAGRLAAGRPVVGLRNVVWHQPLEMKGAIREVETTLSLSGEEYAFGVGAAGTSYTQGGVVCDHAGTATESRLDIAAISARCTTVLSASECGHLVKAQLGSRMQGLTLLAHNGDEALATLALPGEMVETIEDFVLHPVLLNSALQAANVLAQLTHPQAGVPTPFGLDALWIHRPLSAEAYAHVTWCTDVSESSANSRLSRFDVVLTDRTGEVAISLRGYAAVSTSQGRETGETLLAMPRWQDKPPSPTSLRETATPIFILTDSLASLCGPLQVKYPHARVTVLADTADDPAAECERRFSRVFEMIQNSVESASDLPQPLLLLVADSVEADAVVGATGAGLFRTVRMEQPRIEAKVVRGGAAQVESTDTWLQVVETELGQSPEDIDVRWDTGDARAVRSLQEIPQSSNSTPPQHDAGEVVWITGGLGGIGRVFARHYAIERKAQVFLSGRSALDKSRQAFLHELEEQGGRVHYLQGDVARPAEVKAMLQDILRQAGTLHGIIHGAGVIEDAYIAEKDPAAMARVWAPKVAGVLALDAATQDLDLNFFALFSSLTGSFGNAGQADYAGANAFLDQFAVARNRQASAGQRRGHTVSLAWPLWQDGGMTMDVQNERLLQQRSGLTPMNTEAGIAAFHQALGADAGHVLVLHGDGKKIRAKLLAQGAAVDPTTVGPAQLPPLNTPGVDDLQSALVGIVADQQKMAPAKIELDVELPQYGFDSLRLTELANRLNQAYGLDLMPTLFFEHTTLRAIARHLIEKHPAAIKAGPVLSGVASSNAVRTVRRRRSTQGRREGTAATPARLQPIAIVGVSGRFPGSNDVHEFWRHIAANRDLISEVPADRWDWRELFGDPTEQPGKTNVKHAGFMRGIDQFDPTFFGISPREAISMDPQFRLLLETVWATVEDAGYRASDLSGTKTGVFVGVSTSDYKDAWMRHAEASAPGQDGPALVSHFVVANRISYILNLHGPSEPIDTACSSSLIAIHRAIEAMRQGNCEQAIVGGVNVIASPDITIGASRAGMLSEDGRCKTFDQAADGYGRGEGVGALLLKPLDAAIRDGDHVYALVRGSAENHGGKAHSPTAPNPAAQRDLLVAAYTRAEIDPRSVGYIEAHGTGTALGDPIEIEGLTGAFGALYERQGLTMGKPHCGVGSVKTNIGHLEAAAGIAGVLKVVMMLQHRQIPGNGHLHEPNPYLRLEGTPCYLVRETEEWLAVRDDRQRTLPRRAGVSSFGIGGSNAHVILEEYRPTATVRQRAPMTDRPQAIVFSARHPESLKVLAANLRDALRDEVKAEERPSLAEVAYTLQVGRESWAERVGFVAGSLEEVIAHLDVFLTAVDLPNSLLRGQVPREVNASPVVLPSWSDDPFSWVEQWVQGAKVDWRELWTADCPGRVSLPSYPFARKRYWFDTPSPQAKAEHHEPIQAAPAWEPKAEKPRGGVESIEDFLADSLIQILYLESDTIDRQQSFIDLGLDSVLAVEWVQTIRAKYGVKIPATKVYDYSTVEALAAYLASQSEGDDADPTPPVTLSLDEILVAVSTGRMNVAEAEVLLDALDLNALVEQEGGAS